MGSLAAVLGMIDTGKTDFVSVFTWAAITVALVAFWRAAWGVLR